LYKPDADVGECRRNESFGRPCAYVWSASSDGESILAHWCGGDRCC